MASLIQGFAYDVFISYRHNDNRTGWVTDFVDALRAELAGALKDEVSIYFDNNPHDGILEIHDVERSLEGKMNCVIFIPILSQTYCDTTSYAWRNEFCLFNKISKKDSLGQFVVLSNGNVSPRILPVKIHELDDADKLLLESETGSLIRGIEFIFQAPGVNRPLLKADKREENFRKVVYHDQVNKVANAVKSILQSAIQTASPTETNRRPAKTMQKKPALKKITFTVFAAVFAIAIYLLYTNLNGKKGIVVSEKSIAVLAFSDMSPGKDQEYLGDGIADQIINSLSRYSELKVIGRTSSFQFKGSKTDLREIGNKLQVATILDGSIQKIGDNIRVNTQLINVADGRQLWSERFDRNISDIFAIEDEIATTVTQKLTLSLLKGQLTLPKIMSTKNMEAYEMVMKGNFFLRLGPRNARKATEYYQKALALDSNYVDARIGNLLSMMFFSGGGEEKVLREIEYLQLQNGDPILLNGALLTYTLWNQGDWRRAAEVYQISRASGFPRNITEAYFEAAVRKDIKQAVRTMEEVVKLDPLYLDALRNLAYFYMFAGDYTKVYATIDRIAELDPEYVEILLLRADVYLRENRLREALDICKLGEKQFPASPDFLRLKVHALCASGNVAEAKKLIIDKRVASNPVLNWDLPTYYFAVGMSNEAFEWLEQNASKNHSFIIKFLIDPMFEPYREDERFKAILKSINFPV